MIKNLITGINGFCGRHLIDTLDGDVYGLSRTIPDEFFKQQSHVVFYEWNIEPDDLRDIRRIEIEVHKFSGMPSHRRFEEMLKYAGFNYTTDIKTAQAVIFHCEAR